MSYTTSCAIFALTAIWPRYGYFTAARRILRDICAGDWRLLVIVAMGLVKDFFFLRLMNSYGVRLIPYFFA